MGRAVRLVRARKLSPWYLPTHFPLPGNPGTGKTTVAKVMAKVLHKFGLLATDHLEITSGLDLAGQYVGQTKEKARGWSTNSACSCLRPACRSRSSFPVLPSPPPPALPLGVCVFCDGSRGLAQLCNCGCIQVAKFLEAARGGVLFIDEAYAMSSGGFGEEAVNKLVGMLTGGCSWCLGP